LLAESSNKAETRREAGLAVMLLLKRPFMAQSLFQLNRCLNRHEVFERLDFWLPQLPDSPATAAIKLLINLLKRDEK
jgi:hypothetical protein